MLCTISTLHWIILVAKKKGIGVTIAANAVSQETITFSFVGYALLVTVMALEADRLFIAGQIPSKVHRLFIHRHHML